MEGFKNRKRKFKTAAEFINYLLRECEKGGGEYIFRGTGKFGDGRDRVSSSLYRIDSDKTIWNDYYRPMDLEEEIVEKARKYYPKQTTNIEILTDLQHYEGKTTLIDFTSNMNVALFFACTGEKEEREEREILFIDKKNGMDEVEAIRYKSYAPGEEKNKDLTKEKIIKPSFIQASKNRSLFQSSIFVHAPKGYIEKSLYAAVPIPPGLEEEILDHLKKYYGIDIDTIYNDIFGFIKNERNYETVFTWFARGTSKSRGGNHREAIKDFDKAIELGRDSPAVHNNRGVAHADLGKYEEAIKDYTKAIELDPNDAGAYSNRGAAYADSGKYEEAIKDYDKAIKLDSKYAAAHNNRGAAYADSGKYEEAIKDYDKAIDLNPKYAKAYSNRGCTYTQLGRYEEVIKDFNKAIDLNPKYAAAYHNRGLAYRKLGRRDEAEKDFKKAKELRGDQNKN